MKTRKVPLGVNIVTDLGYFNFEPSLSLRWCLAGDFDGSQILVTTGGF